MQPQNPPPLATPAEAPSKAQIQADQAMQMCRTIQDFSIHTKLRAASIDWSEDARAFCFQQFVELAQLFRPKT